MIDAIGVPKNVIDGLFEDADTEEVMVDVMVVVTVGKVEVILDDLTKIKMDPLDLLFVETLASTLQLCMYLVFVHLLVVIEVDVCDNIA